MWRNWYTHRSQKPAGNHVGSIPTIDTNDVSVRTNRTELIQKSFSTYKMDDFFLLQKSIVLQSPRVLNVGQNS